MKTRKTAFVLAFCLLFALFVPSAFADSPKVSVSELVYYPYVYLDQVIRTAVYAVITNHSDSEVQVPYAHIHINDKNGEPLNNKTTVSIYPSVIKPGKSAIIHSSYIDLPDATNMGQVFEVQITLAEPQEPWQALVQLPVEDRPLRIRNNYRDEYYIEALVNNPTVNTVYQPRAALIVRDEQGKLVFADDWYNYKIGILPNHSLLLVSQIGNYLLGDMLPSDLSGCVTQVIAYYEVR